MTVSSNNDHLAQSDPADYISTDQLPGDRCKYKQWHHLHNNDTNANELKCPRIRKGPQDASDTDSSSSSSEDDIEKARKTKRHDYRSPYENWKEVEFANLSYQDLGHDYQERKFLDVLNSLEACRQLNITQNCLVNLKSVKLRKCKSLNATKNQISTFRRLPVCPHLLHLNLTENNISSLTGCDNYKSLKSLVLLRNPIQYTSCYRRNTFKAFPNLQVLDGVPLTEEDLVEPEEASSSTCTVS